MLQRPVDLVTRDALKLSFASESCARPCVPPRDPNVRLQDIVGAIERILDDTASILSVSLPLTEDCRRGRAQSRRLGEAARHVDAETMRQLPTRLARHGGSAKPLIYEDSGVSFEIVWATISATSCGS